MPSHREGSGEKKRQMSALRDKKNRPSVAARQNCNNAGQAPNFFLTKIHINGSQVKSPDPVLPQKQKSRSFKRLDRVPKNRTPDPRHTFRNIAGLTLGLLWFPNYGGVSLATLSSLPNHGCCTHKEGYRKRDVKRAKPRAAARSGRRFGAESVVQI